MTRHSRDRLFLKFSRVSFPAAKVDKLFYSGLWDVNSSLHGKPQMHVQRAANINKRGAYFCLRPFIYIYIDHHIYIITYMLSWLLFFINIWPWINPRTNHSPKLRRIFHRISTWALRKSGGFDLAEHFTSFTLWLFNIAMENHHL